MTCNIQHSYLLHALMLMLLFTSTTFGQSTVGQISGTVSDQAGAAVPGTGIIITNEATGLVRAVTTNDDGFYVVANLPPGMYSVAGERQSFKRFVQANNTLVADGRLTVGFALEPGEVTETVEVSSTIGETVNTTSGEMARVVFNIFNRANFLGLNTNVTNSDFASVTTSAPGRNVQLGLKLTF